jgi:hypothetical protein
MLLGISELEDLSDPQFLIPPYFLFSSLADKWYEISINCIKHAINMNLKIPIQPILHFNIFNNWPVVVETLKKYSIMACWLYPDCYMEHEEDIDSLKNFKNIVNYTASEKIKPYMLFGGYYSVLMQYFGLSGFANGIGYGEWRSSNYHRGGTAMARIYILKLHRYLDAPTAQHIIDQDSEGYFVSDSKLLMDCVSTGRKLTELSLIESLDHFMECRSKEISFVAANNISKAIKELNNTCEYLNKIGPLESEKFGSSLLRWISALSQ